MSDPCAAGPAGLALFGAPKDPDAPRGRTPEVMSDYPIVDLSIDELLTTTRSVRKRLDLTKPVPIGLIRECLEIAVQAPTSANVQNWSFIIVTDTEQRRAIADVYRRTWDLIVASPSAVADRFKDDPARNREQRKVSDSAAYLAEHSAKSPS
jgi:nitroreductase